MTVIVRYAMADKCFFLCGKEAQRSTLLLGTKQGGYTHPNNVVRACRACVKRIEDEGITFFTDGCPKLHGYTAEPYKAALDIQGFWYKCEGCGHEWGTTYSMKDYVNTLLQM